MWSEKIENEKNSKQKGDFFHNTCNGFKPLFSGNMKVTKIFYNGMTFLNFTNINNIYALENTHYLNTFQR